MDHYENFPVASLLLPRTLRRPVAAIYRFARSADDIADEGNSSSAERLAQLQAYDEALNAIASGLPIAEQLAPVFEPLADEHQRTGLPLDPCHALLSAFIQDTQQTRYENYVALQDYCARSANPIGHLMLFLFGADTLENRTQSDAICTALQLTNHWQDIALDAAKGEQGRIYLPLDDLTESGYSESDILSGNCLRRDPARWAEFMRFQTGRVESLFAKGAALPASLGKRSWRIGQELRLTIAGARKILQKINAVNGDVFNQRPVLRKRDWLGLLLRG